MNSKVWDRFDFRAVSLFSGHTERMQTVKAEFDRVGLEVTPFWGCRTEYDAVIERNIRHSRMVGNGAYLNITLKHLQMVKTAYELGAEHALFFEDDIRFLKDEDLIEDIVSGLPIDYDVALFDWVHRNKATDEDYQNIVNGEKCGGHGLWRRFKDLRSCAFYALSRRAMAKYVNILSLPAFGMGKLKICDQHWWDLLSDDWLKGYCAVPCAGVQGVPGGASPYDDMWKRYNRSGITRERYA